VADTEGPSRSASIAATTNEGATKAAVHPHRVGLFLFAVALAVCLLAYLVAVVPGNWFPGASTMTWSAAELSFTRGFGVVENDALVVTALDATGTAVISLDTDFRSNDYRAIAWNAIDVPERANLRLLWRTDYAPGKLNSVPLTVASGHLLPASLARDPNWIGRIRGIALLVQGPLPGPFRIRGVAAKPLGAIEIAGDRVREWFKFEGFPGTSIDSVTGGDDVQDLPMPVLLAAVTLGAIWWYVVIHSQEDNEAALAKPVAQAQKLAATAPAASAPGTLAEPPAAGGLQEPPGAGDLPRTAPSRPSTAPPAGAATRSSTAQPPRSWKDPPNSRAG